MGITTSIPDEQRDIHFADASPILWNLAAGLTYAVAAVSGVLLLPSVDPLVAVWPATGVALAAFLLRGNLVLPGLFLASLLVNSILPVPASATIGISIASTLAPWLAARTLQRRLKFDILFSRLRDVVHFVLVGCLQAILATPTVGITALLAAKTVSWSDAPELWLNWAMADCLGILAVAPILLSMLERSSPRAKVSLEGFISGAVLVAATGWFFAQRPPVGYPVMLVVVWITIRFSQRRAAVTILAVTLIALWAGMHATQLSPAAPPSSLARVLNFLIFMATGTLVLSGLISERRKSELLLLRAKEDRLQQSESQFRDAFDAAAQGMAIVGLEGAFLLVNEALCRITGYPEAELLGRDFQSITHPDDLAYDYERIQALTSGTESRCQFEKRYIHKSGEIVRVLLSVSMVRAADGTPLYYVVQILDVTDQKRAEELWRFGLEGAGDVVWDWDIASGAMALSGGTRELLKCTQDAMPDTVEKWREHIHPDDVAQATARINAILTTASPAYASEYRVRCHDGSTKWVLSRGLVISRDQNDMPLRAVGTFADMTTVRAADADRAALLKQYSDFVMSSRDAIVTLDRQGLIQTSNPATTDIFGYSAGELFQQPLDLLLPEDGSGFHAGAAQKLFESPELAQFMARLRTVKAHTKAGEPLLLQVTLAKSNLHDKERAVATIRDVTEIERLRDMLHQSDKMAALGQLSGGVAHDVNNDLSVILGSAELMLERAPAGSHDQALASRIINTVRRSSDLISRMLVFSRQAKINPESLELQAFLNGFIDTLGRTLGGQIRIQVEANAAAAPFWVQLDRSMLESCLINLSINARDAMPGGGVLTFSLSAARGTVTLTVADTGSGMSDTVRNKIFEPFFTTKPAGGGTGLGLATVYGFVQQSDGQIRVESTLGRGTRFILGFPCVAAPLADAPAQPAPAPAVRKRAVLLVDDNVALRQTLREQLEGLGCQVREAGTFDEAVAVLESGAKIDFVISDFDLGAGLNGVQLAQWMADNGHAIPGAIISGYLNFPATALADWRSLQKPVQLAELRQMLAAIEDDAVPPRAAPAGAAVLVVEDNDDMREITAAILARNGYRVVEAASAEEALARLAAAPVDLVLTDLGLPGLSGNDLVDQLRQDFPHLRILVMSGNRADALSAEKNLRAGCYVKKPFTQEGLARSVAGALSRDDRVV